MVAQKFVVIYATFGSEISYHLQLKLAAIAVNIKRIAAILSSDLTDFFKYYQCNVVDFKIPA